MRAFAQLAVLGYWLLSAACGQPGSFLYVQITGIPTSARSIMVQNVLGQVAAAEEILLPISSNGSSSIGLRLIGTLDDDLRTSVGVFDAMDCLLAAGGTVTKLQASDEYREIAVSLEPTLVGSIGSCRHDDPVLFSISPSQILTTGRDGQRNPVPLSLHGWGFRPGMQVSIGRRLQPVLQVLSFEDAVIDSPWVQGELGPTRVTVTLPDQRVASLAMGLTVEMAPIVTTAAANLNIAAPVLDVAAGDFDGDGRHEIAVLFSNSAIGSYSYQEQTGFSQRERPAMLVSTGLASPDSGSLISADVDGDRVDDLVAVTPSGCAVLKSQPGSPSKFTLLQSAAGIKGNDAALGDINHDGRLDLVLGGAELAVFPGAGGGTFALTPSQHLAISTDAVRLADLNRDGWLDVVGLSATGELMLLLNDAGALNLRLRYPVLTGCPGSSASLAVADFNNDGTPDVVVNGIAALFLDLAGSLDLRYFDGALPCYGGIAVAAADLNGDGQPDLAWLQTSSLEILAGIGYGRVSEQLRSVASYPQSIFQFGYAGPRHLPAADINGDGTPDLVFLNGVLFTSPQ